MSHFHPPQKSSPENRRTALKAFGLFGLSALSGCSLWDERRKPNIALVLGSGAARGFAHIGVIKILEAQGIRPNMCRTIWWLDQGRCTAEHGES